MRTVLFYRSSFGKKETKFSIAANVLAFALSLASLGFLGACNDDTLPQGGDPGPGEGDTIDPNNPGDGLEPAKCDDPLSLDGLDFSVDQVIEEGCYFTSRTISPNGAKLTIEAGTTILFAQDQGMSFGADASLTAKGEKDKPITFKGATDSPWFWKGLYFRGSKSNDNILDYVIIDSAGSAKWHGTGVSRAGIFVDGDSHLKVSNSSFRKNAQAALIFNSAGGQLQLEDSDFSDNASAIWLYPKQVSSLKGLAFSDNDDNVIALFEGGYLEEDATWPTFEAPYRIEKVLTLNASLTLSAGSILEFTDNVGIKVSADGSLNAEGNEDEPIVFRGTQEEAGSWRGIQFEGSNSSKNKLSHIILDGAGGGKWHGGASSGGIFIRQASQLVISDSVFSNNLAAAIFVDHNGTKLSVSGTSFDQNEVALWIPANYIGSLEEDLAFSDNDKDYIRVAGGGNITDSAFWRPFEIPYRFESSYDIENNANVTILPGVTIEFAKDMGLKANSDGTLTADGRDGERIRLVAAEGEMLSGYWKGIAFEGSKSSKNVLANLDLLYAGSKGWHGGHYSIAGLFVRDNAQLELDDVLIEKSGKYGISIHGEGLISPCSDVVLLGNVGGDLYNPNGVIDCPIGAVD